MLEARCRRDLPGTGCRHSAFETDFSPDAVWGLFLLFNFSVQISYDRLSFDGGVLTNASELTFFLDNV